jgi:hypothetical protein
MCETIELVAVDFTEVIARQTLPVFKRPILEVLDERLKEAAAESAISFLMCTQLEVGLEPLIEGAKEELSVEKFLSVDMEDIRSFFNSIELSNGHLVTIYIVLEGEPCPIYIIDQDDTAEVVAPELQINIEQVLN